MKTRDLLAVLILGALVLLIFQGAMSHAHAAESYCIAHGGIWNGVERFCDYSPLRP